MHTFKLTGRFITPSTGIFLGQYGDKIFAVDAVFLRDYGGVPYLYIPQTIFLLTNSLRFDHAFEVRLSYINRYPSKIRWPKQRQQRILFHASFHDVLEKLHTGPFYMAIARKKPI